MRYSRMVVFVLLSVVLLALAGCSGGSTGSTVASDPFGSLGSNTQGTNSTPTPTGSGTVLSYTLSLSTTSPSGTLTVGPSSTVIATASLKDNNGNVIANQPIKFEEVLPPPDTAAAVSIPTPVVETSSEGTAIDFLRANITETNKDVIIKASTTVNGQLVSSVSTFKIVRNAGNFINFITTKSPTDPDGNLNTLKVEVENQPAGLPREILQLVTFEVLDRNGVPRTLVPVKLSIYSVVGCTANSVFTDSPEAPFERTVTTDNTGLGVFNSSVTLLTPPVGDENSCSVIYKATTADPYATEPKDLFSYGAYIVTLKNIRPK